MRFRRTAVALASLPFLLPMFPAPASAAPAEAPAPGKAALLARWTQAGEWSYLEWAAARRDRPRWATYQFDWTTDLCTRAPERPLGFDFQAACVRHDFGYRNYRLAGALTANKPRLDRVFLADMRRKCRTYLLVLRPVCQLTASTYYHAARKYGDASVLDPR